MEYDEEFFIESCYYTLYVTEIETDVKYNTDSRRDETYEDIKSQESHTFSIDFELTNIKIDRGNNDISDVDYEKSFAQKLFKLVADPYVNLGHSFCDDNLDENTESFDMHIEYNNKNYILIFERE